MNLCSENHDEVCYDARTCPVCDMRNEMEGREESMQHDIDNLAKEIEELRDEVAEA